MQPQMNTDKHRLDFMDKLLDGVYVEWKPLGEMDVRTKGTKITASQMKAIHKDEPNSKRIRSFRYG